jgi:hypothetical protein
MLPPLSPTVAAACEFIGLAYNHTGGGCSALEVTLSDECFVMITSTVNECCAPTHADEPVVVGTYASEAEAYEGIGSWRDYATLREALLDLHRVTNGGTIPPALAAL